MTMKLEQVRDKLRRYAKAADNYFNRTRETLELTSAELLADAIDAHLLSQDAEIERLQSGLAAADAMLETTERTLERCKQTLDTTSECWRLDSERMEAAERDSKRLDWLESQREAYGFENCHEGNRWVIDGPFATVRRAIDAAAQEGEG